MNVDKIKNKTTIREKKKVLVVVLDETERQEKHENYFTKQVIQKPKLLERIT